MNILEVIAFTIEGCSTIEKAGAHRIELCDNPGEGGTTPSYGMIKAAKACTNIDLYPIIRPRGGDFLYSEAEFAIMQEDIQICKTLHCDGIVTGILSPDGSVDAGRCARLVQLAYPMSVTFHRAFDRTNDLSAALETLIDIGVERVLTSGGYPAAIEGTDRLAALISQADERIIIMPGSGVRSENIAALRATGAVEFHSSARKQVAGKMKYDAAAMNEKLQSYSVDEAEIKAMLMQLA